jgi:hypothetical protein
MFGSLIESIRGVVEGEGHVDQISKHWAHDARTGKRNKSRESGTPLKQAAARKSRREVRRKLAANEPETIRPRVTKGGG